MGGFWSHSSNSIFERIIPDPEMRGYLISAINYRRDLTSPHVILLVGDNNNGKTILVNAINHILNGIFIPENITLDTLENNAVYIIRNLNDPRHIGNFTHYCQTPCLVIIESDIEYTGPPPLNISVIKCSYFGTEFQVNPTDIHPSLVAELSTLIH